MFEELGLTPLSANLYKVFDVPKLNTKTSISPFMQLKTGKPYKIGTAYFEHGKDEVVGPKKKIAIYSKISHQVFVGEGARNMLGLGTTSKTVSPIRHPNYTVFIQSTSVNRVLPGGSQVLYIPD